MILNSKNNQFVFHFSPDFWSERVIGYYKEFYKNLLLPYDNIEDYICSTLQSVDFPGLKIDTVAQTGWRGAVREYKGSQPVKELIDKHFSLTFKASEGWMNYILLMQTIIDFQDHTNTKQNFDCFSLGILNNEGYLMYTLFFKKLLITDISKFSLDYTQVDNTLNKLTISFKYTDWDIKVDFNKMINLYTSV